MEAAGFFITLGAMPEDGSYDLDPGGAERSAPRGDCMLEDGSYDLDPGGAERSDPPSVSGEWHAPLADPDGVLQFHCGSSSPDIYHSSHS